MLDIIKKFSNYLKKIFIKNEKLLDSGEDKEEEKIEDPYDYIMNILENNNNYKELKKINEEINIHKKEIEENFKIIKSL